MVQFSEITNAKIEEFLNGHGIEIDLTYVIILASLKMDYLIKVCNFGGKN